MVLSGGEIATENRDIPAEDGLDLFGNNLSSDVLTLVFIRSGWLSLCQPARFLIGCDNSEGNTPPFNFLEGLSRPLRVRFEQLVDGKP